MSEEKYLWDYYNGQGYFPFMEREFLYDDTLDPWDSRHPRAPIYGFNMLKFAPTKKEFKKRSIQDCKGYFTSTGRIYMLCPFHEEKTPSLLVTFSKDYLEWDDKWKRWQVRYTDEKFNKWKCFGCGEGGSNLYHLLNHIKTDYNKYYANNQWEKTIQAQRYLQDVVDNDEIPF